MDPLAVLFERFRGGDVDALGEVFDRTAPRLLRLAMHLVGTAADAEDLVQTTFVQAIRLAERFDAERPLLPWLMALLAGQARNLLKSRQRKAAEPLPELGDNAEAPPEAAARAEVLALLRRGVTRLPAEQRQVLLLQLQHGLSPAEIADVLEVPAGTVRMRLHRGIQRLRAWLPASLAFWLTSWWPERGLAAMRGELLQLAASGIPAHATPIVATLLMKKKLFALAVALAALAALWWQLLPPSSALAGQPPGLPQAVTSDLAAAATSGTAPPVPPSGERSAVAMQQSSLQVVVRGREGDPVVDLPVFLWREGGDGLPGSSVAAAHTDAQGVVEFAGLQPGLWLAGPCNAASSVAVTGQTTILTIELATHRLRGRVVDAVGRPVADALIELSEAPDWIGESSAGSADQRVRIAARSDANGGFVCVVISEEEPQALGESCLAARHVEFGASGRHLTRNGLTSELVLVLEPFTATCWGHVVDAAGRRLAGVLVGARRLKASQTLRRADGSWRGPPFAVLTRTDAAGAFRLPLTWRGTTAVMAQQSGFALTTQLQENAGEAPVELVLRPSRIIAGTVLRADGQPAANQSVEVRSKAVFSCRTDGAGRFLLEDVAPGELTLRVRDAQNGLLHQSILAAEVDATALRIVLPPTFEVQGRLVDSEGKELRDFGIQSVGKPGVGHMARTDARGEFVLPAATAEKIAVAVFAPCDDEAASPLAVFSAIPGQHALLRLDAQAMPRAEVSGTVVDERGEPIAAAEVVLQADSNSPWVQRVTTGSDGSFVFRHLAATAVVLRIDATGPGRRVVRRCNSSSGDLGPIMLLPAAQLRIEPVQANGDPWRAMLPEIYLQHLDEPLGVIGHRFVDGIMHCEVMAGAVRVALDDPSVIAEPQVLQLAAGGAATLRWALQTGRRFTLQFAAPDEWVRGQPDAPLQVRIVTASGGTKEHSLRRSRFEPQRWVLPISLPFGRHRVEATRSDGLVYGGEVEADDAVERSTTVVIPRLR